MTQREANEIGLCHDCDYDVTACFLCDHCAYSDDDEEDDDEDEV